MRFLLFLIFIFNLFLNAFNKTDYIAKIISQPIYTSNKKELKTVLNFILSGDNEIYEITVKNKKGQTLADVYRTNGSIIFDMSVHKAPIKIDNKTIAYLIIYTKNHDNIGLTPPEKAWIKTHIVKVGVSEWKPMIFSNTGKDVDGLCGDFLREIIKLTGLKIRVVSKNWDIVLNDFKKGKIDLIPDAYYSDKRATYGFFSEPYFASKEYIYVKKSNNTIHSFEDLKGKKLAIPKGYATIGKVKKKFPKIKIVETKNLEDAINKVLAGKADALYDSQIVVEQKMQENMITGLKAIPQNVFKASNLYFFISKKDPVLYSIIQKALKAIPYEKRMQMTKKWLNVDNIILTPREEDWIFKKIPIKYGYHPNLKPLEFANKLNRHDGIIADLLQIISDKSGLIFQDVYFKNFKEAINSIKNKQIDMLSAVIETDENKEYLNFTKHSLFSFYLVFITNEEDKNFYTSINELKNKKIGIVTNSLFFKDFTKKYPSLHFTELNSLKEGLKKISNKKIDMLILDNITAAYQINNFYPNLHLAYKTDITYHLKIALRKNMPIEPLRIMDKALELIPQAKKEELAKKWTKKIITHKTTDWNLILKIVLGFIIVLTAVLWSNKKLKDIVNEKTKELQELLNTLEDKVKERTYELQQAKEKVEKMHKHTKASIEYASLIQNALLPDEHLFKKAFRDYFIIYKPKDIVGGDIYLFEEVREGEYLLFVIDCTGHGVPGAFVTMIVKSIEKEIMGKINNKEISTSEILSYFNQSMKKLLKQEDKNSISNEGFDGGIIYYNKKKNIIKFSGANTPLFYIQNNELNLIKGDAYSVGYNKCEMDYKYKEYLINLEEGMKFYITTDGFIDQNGGKKGFPFGKKRFKKLIEENYYKPMSKQKEIFLKAILEWAKENGENEQNDDITVIGFEI